MEGAYGSVCYALERDTDLTCQRISSTPHRSTRCKLSVVAEATADCHYSVDRELLAPYDDHFHPTVKRVSSNKPEHRRLGQPFVAVNMVPHADQVSMMLPFQPLLTRPHWMLPSGNHPRHPGEVGLLLAPAVRPEIDATQARHQVRTPSPVSTLLCAHPYPFSSLAPGAGSLLKPLTDPSLPPEQRIDPHKPPRALSLADWALVIRAFDQWPFAPEVSTFVFSLEPAALMISHLPA